MGMLSFAKLKHSLSKRHEANPQTKFQRIDVLDYKPLKKWVFLGVADTIASYC